MNKTMSEYESIRSEIISMEEQQRNVWIYMYVLFITLFVLGIEWSYNFFLVTYIILILFQIVINRYNWSIAKMSTYIRIFYESNIEELNWESLHVYLGYSDYLKNLNSGLSGIIRYTGGSQLGFLATFFYILFLLKGKYVQSNFALGVLDIISIIVSVVLFCVTVMINRDYNKKYDKELENIIR